MSVSARKPYPIEHIVNKLCSLSAALGSGEGISLWQEQGACCYGEACDREGCQFGMASRQVFSIILDNWEDPVDDGEANSMKENLCPDTV